MAFVKQYNAARPVTQPMCIHLRSKAIFVTGELKNPDHPDEEGSHYAWCNLTQHVKGPDRGDCDRCTCIPGRGCYRDA